MDICYSSQTMMSFRTNSKFSQTTSKLCTTPCHETLFIVRYLWFYLLSSGNFHLYLVESRAKKPSTTMEAFIIRSADLLQLPPSKALSVARNAFLQAPLSLNFLNIYEVLRTKLESLSDYKSVYLIGSNVPKARVSGGVLKSLALIDFRGAHLSTPLSIFLSSDRRNLLLRLKKRMPPNII